MPEHPALPRGRGERRTRLYTRPGFVLVYDSATSNMHPEDFFHTSGHTEMHIVIDLPTRPAFRWSGLILRKSRRKVEYVHEYDTLKYLTWLPNPLAEPARPPLLSWTQPPDDTATTTPPGPSK